MRLPTDQRPTALVQPSGRETAGRDCRPAGRSAARRMRPRSRDGPGRETGRTALPHNLAAADRRAELSMRRRGRRAGLRLGAPTSLIASGDAGTGELASAASRAASAAASSSRRSRYTPCQSSVTRAPRASRPSRPATRSDLQPGLGTRRGRVTASQCASSRSTQSQIAAYAAERRAGVRAEGGWPAHRRSRKRDRRPVSPALVEPARRESTIASRRRDELSRAICSKAPGGARASQGMQVCEPGDRHRLSERRGTVQFREVVEVADAREPVCRSRPRRSGRQPPDRPASDRGEGVRVILMRT